MKKKRSKNNLNEVTIGMRIGIDFVAGIFVFFSKKLIIFEVIDNEKISNLVY